MVEENADVKKSSSMGIVGELLRPFGSKAYKETREAGGDRIQSAINGGMQAFMPATYGMMERLGAYQKERSSASASKEELEKKAFSNIVGFVCAAGFDTITNILTVIMPPSQPIHRWIYGQVATRLYEK